MAHVKSNSCCNKKENTLIECFMSRCCQKVPMKRYLEHLKKCHSNRVNGVENMNKYLIEWWINGDKNAAARWPPYYFTCFGQAFLYMAVSTNHGSFEWVWIIAEESEAKKFHVKAKMENLDKSVSLQWIGPVHSIRKSINSIIDSGYCFVTNCKDIDNPFMFRKEDIELISNEDNRNGCSYSNKYCWRTEVEILQGTPQKSTEAAAEKEKSNSVDCNVSPAPAPAATTNYATKGSISRKNSSQGKTGSIVARKSTSMANKTGATDNATKRSLAHVNEEVEVKCHNENENAEVEVQVRRESEEEKRLREELERLKREEEERLRKLEEEEQRLREKEEEVRRREQEEEANRLAAEEEERQKCESELQNRMGPLELYPDADDSKAVVRNSGIVFEYDDDGRKKCVPSTAVSDVFGSGGKKSSATADPPLTTQKASRSSDVPKTSNDDQPRKSELQSFVSGVVSEATKKLEYTEDETGTKRTSNAPEGKRTSDAPESKRASDAPESKRTSDAPEFTRTSDAPEFTRTSDAPEVKRTSDAQEVKRISDAPEVKRTSDAQEVKRISDAPEVKRTSDASEVKRTSDAQEVKRISDVPEVKRTSEAQEVKRISDIQEVKRTSDAPKRSSKLTGNSDDAAAASEDQSEMYDLDDDSSVTLLNTQNKKKKSTENPTRKSKETPRNSYEDSVDAPEEKPKRNSNEDRKSLAESTGERKSMESKRHSKKKSGRKSSDMKSMNIQTNAEDIKKDGELEPERKSMPDSEDHKRASKDSKRKSSEKRSSNK